MRGEPPSAHVRGDRAVLLRHPGHVQHGHAFALQVRSHPEQRADGDYAGAADAGDEDVVRRAINVPVVPIRVFRASRPTMCLKEFLQLH